MNPFRTTSYQVSGPPWPLPSARAVLSWTNPCCPSPFCHRLTDLTRLAHPMGLINPINRPFNQSSVNSHSPSLPPDDEISLQPAHRSSLTSTSDPEKPDVHPPRLIRSRPNCLRRLQRLYVNGHSTHPPPSHIIISCLSFLAMASRIDKSSGFSGERNGAFHLLMVHKPSQRTPVRPRP